MNETQAKWLVEEHAAWLRSLANPDDASSPSPLLRDESIAPWLYSVTDSIRQEHSLTALHEELIRYARAGLLEASKDFTEAALADPSAVGDFKSFAAGMIRRSVLKGVLRGELVHRHQGYMRRLVGQIHKTLPSHVDFEELAAFGQVGLVEAASRFDPCLGVAFETFAYHRIRGAVFEGIGRSTWLPPSSAPSVAAEAGANEVMREAAETAGDARTREESASVFREVVRSLGVVFLAAELPQTEAPDSSSVPGIDEDEVADVLSRLESAIKSLPEQSRTVVRMFYHEHKTFTQIGAIFGKNKSTAMRWHNKAILELRKALEPTEGGGRASRSGS